MKMLAQRRWAAFALVVFQMLSAAAAPYAYSCQTSRAKFDYKFCDTNLGLDERLDDLVSRIGWDDAGPQMTARESPAIPSIGLASYYWGTNAANVLSNIDCLENGQCVTNFPAPSSLGAAWNYTLVREMASVFATELRAYVNAGKHNGLDIWGPTINVARDPRWGRNFETSSEDPTLLGHYAKAYTRGLQQGEDERYLKAVVTLKHWIAYSLESYGNYTRHNFDANVSAYDLADTYMPAWEVAVKEGGALGVMCSYNAVNGAPTCANPKLMKILREDWGFKGYVTSDSDSCKDVWKEHQYVRNGSEATAACIEGGTDINSGNTYAGYLHDAIDSNLMSANSSRNALRNGYRVRMKLGLFDPHESSPYREIPQSVVGQPAHQALSEFAAGKAMVLLKNEDGILPFPKGQRLAVIGAAANDVTPIIGKNAGPICPNGSVTCFPTLFQGLRRINEGGETRIHTDINDTKSALQLAEWADLVVLIANDTAGHEGQDRYTISLDENQLQFCEKFLEGMEKAKKAKKAASVVLLLVHGGPVSIDKLVAPSPAILDAFTPGPHGAKVIAETIFGDNNPGGKLPITIYPSDYVDKVSFLDMSMEAGGVGRTYRYYTGTPLFAFGYGLSYTSFSMKWCNTSFPSSPPPPSSSSSSLTSSPALSSSIVASTDALVNYTVIVTNTGNRKGDEVVQLYAVPPPPSDGDKRRRQPLRFLLAFERVTLSPGESKKIYFSVDARGLSLVDMQGNRVLYTGSYGIEASRGHGDPLSATLNVEGEDIVLATFRKFW